MVEGIYPSTSFMLDTEFRVACLQGKKMPAIISLIYLMFSLLVFTKKDNHFKRSVRFFIVSIVIYTSP